LEIGRGLVRSKTPHLASRLYFPGYPAAAARWLAGEPPDIVHVMSCSQFAPALRRALPTAKLVLHLHDELHLRLPAALAGQRLARFGAVATCSGWLERGLRKRFPHLADRIHHIGNGVDLDAFSPAPFSARIHQNMNLLFVGRISPEKGVHVLVDALTMLRGRFRDLNLELVGAPGLLPFGLVRLIGHDQAAEALAFYGAGPLARIRAQILSGPRGYLEALQARLPPAERGALQVRGSLPHDRLPEAYRAAEVFVMPSICEEPFGIPVIEAMACGLPVVATRSGGMPEIVEQGVSGLLVERGDAAGLARAIATLLEAPDLRAAMGAAGRARAERLFGWEQAARRLMGVYEQVAHSSPRGRSEL
jgi:glycosyltransferase involved in cell wall biosynthesis